jgi:hypothetical protein
VGNPFIRRVTIRNYKSIAACKVDLGALMFLVGPGKANWRRPRMFFLMYAMKGSSIFSIPMASLDGIHSAHRGGARRDRCIAGIVASHPNLASVGTYTPYQPTHSGEGGIVSEQARRVPSSC